VEILFPAFGPYQVMWTQVELDLLLVLTGARVGVRVSVLLRAGLRNRDSPLPKIQRSRCIQSMILIRRFKPIP